MRFYFFRNIDAEHVDGFRQLTIQQNAVTAPFISGLAFALSSLTFISSHLVDFGSFVIDIHEYTIVHNFIFYSALICFASLFLAGRLRTDKKFAIYRIVSLAYAICLIAGCLGLTFIAQHNPANTVTMFML